MITPFFTISQDEEFIFIDVKVSHVRFNAKTIEMNVDQQLFIFSLPPYYLRLKLPYNCIDDERSHAEYDSKSESVKIKIPKEIKGQQFPDLDMTAKLLARTNELASSQSTTTKASDKPMIEEMDVNNMSVQDTFKEGEKFDWQIDQQVPNANEFTPADNNYGFNNVYSQIIGVSISNGNDINELGDPENTPESSRIMERLIKENIKFDPEYYASDYILSLSPEDDEKDFQSLMEWKSPLIQKFLKWVKHQQSLPPGSDDKQELMPVEFSQSEQEKMLQLPKKTYLITKEYQSELLILIVSLLFGYHFDLRENLGEHNIESAWTIGKLCPQISCLDSKISIQNEFNKDNSLKAAIITSIRRSLSYPFHRHFGLTMKVWDDVYYNLRGGKRLILKSLLDMKELFRFHDVYYVYDKIWFQDLSAWLISDQVSEMTIRYLAHDLKRELEKVDKSDITFEKISAEEKDGMEDDREPDSDDEDEGEGEGGVEDEDEILALNLNEIEMMAKEM